MFMAAAMAVPLLLLKNTIDGFLCAEFRIVECFTRHSIDCVNACTLPNAHVSSERTRKQNMEEQENILDMVQRSPTSNTRRLSARIGDYILLFIYFVFNNFKRTFEIHFHRFP